MRDVGGRRRAALVALTATIVISGLIPPARTTAADPPGLQPFARAVASVESGGRYTARNSRTGAYGKYQIMPRSWRAWARAYLGNADAPATPLNQERVALAKFRALYRWLGSWEGVAYWWLTGTGQANPARWTRVGARYVARVMAAYGGSPVPQGDRVEETSGAIAYSAGWASARYSGYAGGAAAWTRSAGAVATFTFSGTSIAWIGPSGPTRGSARVYVDGVLRTTVSAYAGRFTARSRLFSLSLPSGKHSITIEALGTARHAVVAIDEFVVGH